MIREIDSLDGFLSDCDWAYVFDDEHGTSTSKKTDPCPPGSDIDLTPANRTDVAEIVGLVNGVPDELDWVGVFRLNDGRYLLASGGCDYSGWG